MEKELNEAAAEGYVFSAVMGGETAFGGKEVVAVMVRKPGEPGESRRYKLLATNKTTTLQKELREAGAAGFDYCGQTVFVSAFGGKEVSVILERNSANRRLIEYKTLATSRTETMQKELREAGAQGFEFLGVMVGPTALGGKEVVSILRRYAD